MNEKPLYNRWFQNMLARIREPTIFKDSYGNIIGTFIPAGQEPPTRPPEPPTTAAAVGAKPNPGVGGPGAAAVANPFGGFNVEDEEHANRIWGHLRTQNPRR
jgi:hypothetical protein